MPAGTANMNLEAKLPPWDAAAYFRRPVQTLVTPGTTPAIVAPGDPMRVVLVFAAPTSSFPIHVGLNDLSGASFGGILVASSVPPIVIAWDDYGPLVQQPWYATGVGTATLTVITQSMTQWPGSIPAGQDNMIVRADRGDFRGKYSPYQQRPKPARLYGYRWMKV